MYEIQRILLDYVVDGALVTDLQSHCPTSEPVCEAHPLQQRVLLETGSGPSVKNNSLYNVVKQVEHLPNTPTHLSERKRYWGTLPTVQDYQQTRPPTLYSK